MMKIYNHPSNNIMGSLIRNRHKNKINNILKKKIQSIIDNVKLYGDKALKNYTKEYDKVNMETLFVTKKEFNYAYSKISQNLKLSIKQAHKNIVFFHKSQIKEEKKIEIKKGVMCWRKFIPIEKIGLYIPGGLAPLCSTVLMLGVPGMLAGCKNIILCSPPDKFGKIHPSILYTAKYLGIKNVYKVGGAQAIAAMAYGTLTIPRVLKIFGPGNIYVTKAKQIVSQNQKVSIDMPAGPSEIVIIADKNANPKYVASDILSQSEHDPESYILIITTNNIIWINNVNNEIKKQLKFFNDKKKIIIDSIKNSKIIMLDTIKQCLSLSNKIAPEHLIINCNNAVYWSNQVINAGSVFLGNYSPVSAGDYASGTNHVLPTNGYAKFYSGISIDSFMKHITFQKISKIGLKKLSQCVNVLSEEEGLLAHKNSINIRI